MCGSARLLHEDEGAEFQTKKRSKKASASGNASAAQPRVAVRTRCAHAKPVIGRFGCSIGGCPTGSSIPIQSLTGDLAEGDTRLSMPGPGFIPSQGAHPRLAKRWRYRSTGPWA